MGRSREKKKPEERKAQILEAAFKCFMAKGYHSATMDDIARTARLSKGAVYWYFKDKQDVFIAYFLFQVESYYSEMKKILLSKKSVEQKIYELGRYLLKKAEQEPDTNRVLHELWIQALEHKKTWKVFKEIYRRSIDEVENLLREGMEKGELRPDINPRWVGFMLNSVMGNLDHLEMIGFEDIDPDQYWQEASRILFEGILPERKSKI